MDTNTLFAKTDKGREALTSRPAGLVPRLRTLLIVVDGKRPVSELDKLVASEGGAAPLLEQLLAAGWVEAVGATAQPPAADVPRVPPPAPPPAPAPVAAEPEAQPVLPFSEARRRVVRFINDELGPMGESLAMRVEACKSPADLQAALPRIRGSLENYKSRAIVQRFDEEIAARLPGP